MKAHEIRSDTPILSRYIFLPPDILTTATTSPFPTRSSSSNNNSLTTISPKPVETESITTDAAEEGKKKFLGSSSGSSFISERLISSVLGPGRKRTTTTAVKMALYGAVVIGITILTLAIVSHGSPIAKEEEEKV